MIGFLSNKAHPMKSLASEIYASFRNTYGPVLAVIGLVVAVLAFFVTPESKIETKWVVAFGCLAAVVFIVLIDFGFRAWLLAVNSSSSSRFG